MPPQAHSTPLPQGQDTDHSTYAVDRPNPLPSSNVDPAPLPLETKVGEWIAKVVEKGQEVRKFDAERHLQLRHPDWMNVSAMGNPNFVYDVISGEFYQPQPQSSDNLVQIPMDFESILGMVVNHHQAPPKFVVAFGNHQKLIKKGYAKDRLEEQFPPKRRMNMAPVSPTQAQCENSDWENHQTNPVAASQGREYQDEGWKKITQDYLNKSTRPPPPERDVNEQSPSEMGNSLLKR